MVNTHAFHVGFTWVRCGSLERQNTWLPRGKLLHTPVCPISGSQTHIRLPNRILACIPSFLATSRCELTSANNLTIRCSICSGNNCVAWSTLKIQSNINSLYRNPTLHKSIKVVMTRQTLLQVTTPELTFFLLMSLSGPQTILTVFGHSVWLCNGSIISTIFRSVIHQTTRNNKYRSNSHKCHTVVVIT